MEYKFRGLTEDDVWVYGDLVTLHYPKRLCIASAGNNQNWSNTEFTEIKPETVGLQYIPEEKNDKPSFDIYQGDIVGEMLGNSLVKYEVKFNGTHFGGWGWVKNVCMYLHPFRFKDCVLIGNIHQKEGSV